MSTEKRLTDLEATVAFQEDIVDKLQRLVGEQQLQIHRLEEEMARVREQMTKMDPSTIRDPKDESPPPHY